MAEDNADGSLEDKRLEDLVMATSGMSREEIFKLAKNVLGEQGFNVFYDNYLKFVQNGKEDTMQMSEIPDPEKLLEDSEVHHAPTIMQNGSSKYPEFIDYYKFITVLGEGGMGAVYKVKLDEEKARAVGKEDLEIRIIKANLGYKPEDKECVVAMKVMKPEALNVIGGKERFTRELDVYKELSDLEGVIDILEDGEDYFIMKILNPIQKEKLDEEDARALAYHAAKVISDVHERGKLHRDIKPDNFLLEKEGDYTSVQASDFGLVKNIGEEATMQTMSKAIMGTPDYMSPEQADARLISHLHRIDEFYDKQVELLKDGSVNFKNEIEDLENKIRNEEGIVERQNLRSKRVKLIEDEKSKITRDKTKVKLTKRLTKFDVDIKKRYNLAFKSDQYAMAATIYTWATGLKPRYMNSGKKMRDGLAENQIPVMALLNDITDANTELKYLPQEVGVSDELSAVILKGMEKNPEDRYDNTEAFVEDLKKVMDNEMPSVLTDDPTILNRRMMRKAGADFYLDNKQYRLGREALDKIVEDLDAKIALDKNEDLLRQKKSWETQLSKYQEGLRARLGEMKECMSSCSDEEFVANIPEFKELLYEVKIVPVEKRIGDKFPSITLEDGKWKLNDGNVSSNGYLVDTYDIGSFKDFVQNRISYLKNKDPTCTIIEDFLKSYLTFGKDYDRTNDKEAQNIFLKRMNELDSQFNSNLEFIPNWNKEELDSQGLKLGGYALGIESLIIIPALFNANRHTSDNIFANMAVKHVDKINETLVREDGSVFRYGIFDDNGNLLKTAVDGLGHHIEGKNPNNGFDIYENGINTSNYTWADGQVYFINGNLDAFINTGDKKYLDYATKGINFAVKQIKQNPDLISNYAYNDSNENPVQNSAPNSMLAVALDKYFKLTGKQPARKNEIKLLKSLIKNKLDISQDYEGLIRGYRDNAKAKEISSIETDYHFLKALSELEKSTLYDSRNFVSLDKGDKLDWNKANYQAGFTTLENTVADEQTELRIMHDDENLYLRIRALGDAENDFYDVLIGDKRFKFELDGSVKTAKISYSKLGLKEKPEQVKFNLLRNRVDEKGKRTTISSWSPNEADVYIEEKKMYFDAKDKLKPEYGTLVLK